MRRIAIVLVFAFAAVPPVASAQKAIGITAGSIVGVKLAMTRAKASSLLHKPVRFDRLEDDYQRLVSSTQKVEVYFRTGTQGAIAVATWNRTFRTDEGIGPCSTVAALKGAYGTRLQPFRQAGKVIAYRLGNLIFTAESTRVGAIGLGRGTVATYIVLNVPECR
jgi:hypothetical protein